MNQNQPTQPREISLIDLFEAIGRGIRTLCNKLGNLLLSICRLAYRQWWIVLLFALFSTAAALYYNRPKNRQYTVEARITLRGVNAHVVRQTYDELAQAATKTSLYAQNDLATMLGIDREDALVLSRFKSYQVLSNQVGSQWADYDGYASHADKKDTTTTLVGNALVLSFRTKRPNRVPEIEEAIMRYLNANPLAIASYQAYHSQLEDELQFQQAQITLLDSIAREFYSAQIHSRPTYTTANTSIMVGKQEMALMNNQINEVYYRKANLEQALAISMAPVMLENHFVASAKAVLSPIFFPIKMLLFGILIGLIVAYLFDNRKRWKEMISL